MLDLSLIKDPVFMFIGLSNVFGMAGLYVPFVYLVDAAKQQVCSSTLFFHTFLTTILAKYQTQHA